MSARAALCPRCGTSTPAPADLSVATFPCAGCGEALSTAEAVGAAVTEAAAFVRGVERALAGGPAPAPAGVTHRWLPPRPGTCLRCKQPVEVPMDLRVRELTCAACGSTQPIAAHVSDAERMAADLQHQLAENARLKSLRAEGVTCPQCGGRVPLASAAVQVACPFCGAAVALAAVAGEGAVAREQLGTGVRGAVDAARQAHAAQASRRDRWILAGVFAVVLLMLGGFAATSLLGTLFAAAAR